MDKTKLKLMEKLEKKGFDTEKKDWPQKARGSSHFRRQ